METMQADQARLAALDRVDRAERNTRRAFMAAIFVEALFILAFVLLADFSNRVHLLLFIATMAIYMILGFGLLAIAAHISRCTLRVLSSIERRD